MQQFELVGAQHRDLTAIAFAYVSHSTKRTFCIQQLKSFVNSSFSPSAMRNEISRECCQSYSKPNGLRADGACITFSIKLMKTKASHLEYISFGIRHGSGDICKVVA